MTKNYSFFINADMSRYVGEWIAIIDAKVVAHGKNAKSVYEQAVENYPKKRPLITKVPGSEAMIF